MESQKDIGSDKSTNSSDTKKAMQILLQHLYTVSDLIPLQDSNDKELQGRLNAKSFMSRVSGLDNASDLHMSSEDEEMSRIIYNHFRAYVHWNPMRIGIYYNGYVIDLKERNISEITHGYFVLFLSLSFVMREIATNFKLPEEENKIKELSINCQIELLKIWEG